MTEDGMNCSCGLFPRLTLPRCLLFVFYFATLRVAAAQVPGIFEPAGNISTPRTGHTATLLYDGRVLIAGGHGKVYGTLKTAVPDVFGTPEVFDPSDGTFKSTANMITPRGDRRRFSPPRAVCPFPGHGIPPLSSTAAKS